MSQNPGLFRRQNDHALEKPPHSTTGVASEVQLQFWKSLHFTPGQHQVRRVHYMYRPKRSIRYSGAHVPVARPIRSRLASLLVITKTRIDKRAHEDRPLGRGFCPHALLGHFVALPHFWCNPAADWCQGRNEMPQNRRSKVPQKRRFEKSPASVVLLHRGRRGKMTEHAGFQFLLQAIALAANVDGDGMMQQAVQDGRRDHMVVKNVTPGAVALVAG